VSTCTFRYKNKTEKHVVVNYRTNTFPSLHPPVQCCGSSEVFLTPASGIRGIFGPCIQIRDGKKSRAQIREEHTDLIFENFRDTSVFGLKILKSFDADPNPGSF
jgi:hypothetical protein